MEIELLPAEERAELAAIYREKGIPAETADALAATLRQDPLRALDVHAREELGLDPAHNASQPSTPMVAFMPASQCPGS